jgi:hypothetical protein
MKGSFILNLVSKVGCFAVIIIKEDDYLYVGAKVMRKGLTDEITVEILRDREEPLQLSLIDEGLMLHGRVVEALAADLDAGLIIRGGRKNNVVHRGGPPYRGEDGEKRIS